ncbi:hypothetical protein HAX54_041589, partial [Datura stramonium]|nr:hypothetical protein [Datura stramonium]
MTISYSPVRCGEIPMEHWFDQMVASVHCFDPTLHWRFSDQDRRLVALLPMEHLPQFTVSKQRVNDSLRIPSCNSPVLCR